MENLKQQDGGHEGYVLGLASLAEPNPGFTRHRVLGSCEYEVEKS